MDARFIPVCTDTDRTAPLKHRKYLAAVKCAVAYPPTSTFISEVIFSMVTAHVIQLLPQPSQANDFKAQRLSRTVGKGCFTRPMFCIMICELLFVPEGPSDTECRRSHRKVSAEFAGCMRDLLYTTGPGYTCKEHQRTARADDDVRTQSHGLFE